MSQTQIVIPKPAVPCPAPKFSAELMRMLAQLVMLR